MSIFTSPFNNSENRLNAHHAQLLDGTGIDVEDVIEVVIAEPFPGITMSVCSFGKGYSFKIKFNSGTFWIRQKELHSYELAETKIHTCADWAKARKVAGKRHWFGSKVMFNTKAGREEEVFKGYEDANEDW